MGASASAGRGRLMDQIRADQIFSFRLRKKQRPCANFTASWQKAAPFRRLEIQVRRLRPPNEHDNRSAPMPFSPRRMFIALIGTVVLAFPFGLASPAIAQTKIKFVLNWKYQGPQGMFF